MKKVWLAFSQLTAGLAILLAALLFLFRLFPDLLPDGLVDVSGEPPGDGRGGAAALSFAAAVNRSLPSVVDISTSARTPRPPNPVLEDPLLQRFFGPQLENIPERVSNLGSGVVIGDGHILTNHHVIEGAEAIEAVLPDGRSVSARVLGSDPETDIAVLQVEAPGLRPITLAPSDSVQVGDIVLAIGNPFGVGRTVTLGIVSALERSHLGINTFERYIQTDAAINPGNSGGALVDTSGRLIGLSAAIFSRSGGNLGIGFAIPVSLVRQVVEQIIAHGEVVRGWVGIEVQDVAPDAAESFGMPAGRGALIAGVLKGGPADRAGVRPGDILLAVDAREVRHSGSLLGLIATLRPGGEVRLKLLRRGQTIELAVPVERRPSRQPG